MFATIFFQKQTIKISRNACDPWKFRLSPNEDVEVSLPKGYASIMNNYKTYTYPDFAIISFNKI